jgi:hypothetical protein
LRASTARTTRHRKACISRCFRSAPCAIGATSGTIDRAPCRTTATDRRLRSSPAPPVRRRIPLARGAITPGDLSRRSAWALSRPPWTADSRAPFRGDSSP